MTKIQNTCLIVIDGWGISTDPDTTGDAIRNAKTPIMTHLHNTYPNVPIAAHGLAVGLPDGLMGNSEVGHLNVGAGRVVYQDIVRIELSIKTNAISKDANLMVPMKNATNGNNRLHLLGLVSDGGVHAHIQHVFKLLEVAKENKVEECFVHVFGDGRDTSPKSILGYLAELEAHIKKIDYGIIGTITGRYYAMDRDKRWERVKLAYEGLCQGVGEISSDFKSTIENRYINGETDEFLKPIICNQESIIKDNDTLLFFNFRSDRMRELTQALGISPIPFETLVQPKNLNITTLTTYKGDFPFNVIYPPQTMKNTLAEWLDSKHIPQCHVAETEKYAHVTFFFNGGIESQFKHEHRDLISSPKVATYDLQPEMSAMEVGQKTADQVMSKEFPFVMCNFAPPDMVGHTGRYEEAIKAIEATDKAIGVIYEACQKVGTILFITADHGNAEKMINLETMEPHTAHTTGKVPFVMTSNEFKFDKSQEPALCDVAPTLLKVMGIDIPSEMTGRSLIM